MLGLKVGINAFAAQFPAPAALLEAPKRTVAGGRYRVVDTDRACLQGFGYPKGSLQVRGEGIGGQAKFGIVGSFQDLRFVPESVKRRYWGKDLLLVTAHLLGYIGKQSRSQKIALLAESVAARHDTCSCFNGLINKAQGGGKSAFIDQRADIDTVGETITHPEVFYSVGQDRYEPVVDTILNINSIGGNT